MLTDVPGKTCVISHKIKLNSAVPVYSKPYPVPSHLKEAFDKEVLRMLELDIIEPSDSPYCSSPVLVKKENGIRVCVDYRALNDVSEFDAEPMPTREDYLAEFTEDVFFTEVDLCKGYWQIPLDPESRKCTAFPTSLGLMQFKMLPFGHKTACATFNRLMRKVVDGLEETCHYFDNILVHSKDWDSHIQNVRRLFERLRSLGLTAGPDKCFLGFKSIKYLGYLLGRGEICPLEERVLAIKNMVRPSTKKELRSFMGTMNFYRQYIPNFSDHSSSLTDMLKKGSPNKLEWESSSNNDFEFLRMCLTRHPILKLPDLKRDFILRTDASNVGLGAVLLQEHGGVLMPVSYASRKLTDSERNYSSIEKECLSIVWAIYHFYRYLCGKEFVLQTDHQPLTYIKQMQNANSRLMRWALVLQNFSFRVQYIRGTENVAADILSRAVVE